MDSAIAISVTLGVIFGYLYINWFIGTRVAWLIASRFAKEDDDDVIAFDEDRGMGRSVMTPVTRGDQRFKYWLFLVIFPLLIYANYKYWDPIWAAMDFVATTAVRFASQFVS